MGLQLRGKIFWWHLCCYYYLKELILISANVTETLREQKTNPLVIYAELISIFLADFFLYYAPIHVFLVWGLFWNIWILFAILQVYWWFSTFSKSQSPLFQTKIHHFPLLGTSQVTPEGRIWWEQGVCDLCLPTPPPLAPAQRMRNSDLSFGSACPLPATSCALSMLLPWKGMTDTALVTLTWRVFKSRICSEVQGPVKVLRFLPSPDLPFLPALLCPFLSPQPWNETENYFFKTVSIIYV